MAFTRFLVLGLLAAACLADEQVSNSTTSLTSSEEDGSEQTPSIITDQEDARSDNQTDLEERFGYEDHTYTRRFKQRAHIRAETNQVINHGSQDSNSAYNYQMHSTAYGAPAPPPAMPQPAPGPGNVYNPPPSPPPQHMAPAPQQMAPAPQQMAPAPQHMAPAPQQMPPAPPARPSYAPQANYQQARPMPAQNYGSQVNPQGRPNYPSIPRQIYATDEEGRSEKNRDISMNQYRPSNAQAPMPQPAPYRTSGPAYQPASEPQQEKSQAKPIVYYRPLPLPSSQPKYDIRTYSPQQGAPYKNSGDVSGRQAPSNYQKPNSVYTPQKPAPSPTQYNNVRPANPVHQRPAPPSPPAQGYTPAKQTGYKASGVPYIAMPAESYNQHSPMHCTCYPEPRYQHRYASPASPPKAYATRDELGREDEYETTPKPETPTPLEGARNDAVPSNGPINPANATYPGPMGHPSSGPAGRPNGGPVGHPSGGPVGHPSGGSAASHSNNPSPAGNHQTKANVGATGSSNPPPNTTTPPSG